MQLALLSGASPKTCGVGPVVRLQAGSYTIHVHGLRDSRLSLNVNGVTDPLEVTNGRQLFLPENTLAQVMFHVRGTEQFINVLAENKNG